VRGAIEIGKLEMTWPPPALICASRQSDTVASIHQHPAVTEHFQSGLKLGHRRQGLAPARRAMDELGIHFVLGGRAPRAFTSFEERRSGRRASSGRSEGAACWRRQTPPATPAKAGARTGISQLGRRAAHETDANRPGPQAEALVGTAALNSDAVLHPGAGEPDGSRPSAEDPRVASNFGYCSAGSVFPGMLVHKTGPWLG